MKKKNKKIGNSPQEHTEKIIDALNLPKDVILELPKLIFTGNRELYVENYRGIIEYSDSVIRLNTNEYILKITGSRLGIKSIAEEEITLNGDIKSLEFD